MGAIKATNVREPEVAWITVQKSATIQAIMKERNIEPYVLPGRRDLHKKQPKETLSSSEDESMEKIEYHKGPQITPELGECVKTCTNILLCQN